MTRAGRLERIEHDVGPWDIEQDVGVVPGRGFDEAPRLAESTGVADARSEEASSASPSWTDRRGH